MSALEPSPDRLLGLCSHHRTVFIKLLKARCCPGSGNTEVVALAPGVCIPGKTEPLCYTWLSPGRSDLRRVKCSESLKKDRIPTFRLSWETSYGPEEFVEKRAFLEEIVADQIHRSEKTSYGIVETEARKLVLIKAMVRTKLTLSLCFAMSKRDMGPVICC